MKLRNLGLCLAAFLAIAGCRQNDADVASRNISTAADNFQILRRIVFYNSINGEYLLQIEGFCSLGNNDTNLRMSVTCKTGPGDYKKHALGLGANVTFISEQLNSANVSTSHYKLVFKPSVIIPDIEIR